MSRVLYVGLFVFLAARPALAQNYKLDPTYGTLTLRGGENSIPSIMKVEAGGNIQTKLGGVAAFVADPPDARINYTAGNVALVIKVESDKDTTLLVNLPDGKWIANDDGPNMGLNPYIRIDNPQSGQYDVWIGTYNKGIFPPAILSVSEATMEMTQKASQYAVVEIENRISKHTVRYKLRWGPQADWGNVIALKPGRAQTHSYPLAGGGRAPMPQIAFEKGIGGVEVGYTQYDLESQSSASKGSGKGYNFVPKTGADTREYVELNIRTKAQEDAAYKLNTAILRTLAGDYRTATKLASAAILIDPTSPRAYTIRGRARQFDGDHDGALRDFATGMKLAPSDAEFVVYRTETFARKKRTDRVIEEATKALELDPFSAAALSERGAAYFAMRNFDAAIADCLKAIKIEPQNYFPLTTLGEAYIAKGQPIFGLDYLNRAIATKPNDFEPYAARAQVYKSTGDSAKSAADYREAMRLKMPAGYQVYYDDAVALRDLDNYPIGKMVYPELLKKFNNMNFEKEPPFPGKAPPVMEKEIEELVTGEWSRHRAFKFESAAGVNHFLGAALLSDEQRKAQGLTLDWYYGPMTSPLARFRSADDLGGLRIIGNLKYPDKKELTMIFAVTYHAPKGEAEFGKVGLLFDGDNSRLQMRIFNRGALDEDMLFAGFDANARKGGKMTMRAAYNLDETTGTLINETISTAALSAKCIHCHNKPFEPSDKLVEQLDFFRKGSNEEIAKLLPVRKFLELVELNGGNRREIAKLEDAMSKKGPATLLPLEEMYNANRQYWLEIYPQYVEFRRDPKSYLENAALRAAPRFGGQHTEDMKALPGQSMPPGGKMPASMPQMKR